MTSNFKTHCWFQELQLHTALGRRFWITTIIWDALWNSSNTLRLFKNYSNRTWTHEVAQILHCIFAGLLILKTPTEERFQRETVRSRWLHEMNCSTGRELEFHERISGIGHEIMKLLKIFIAFSLVLLILRASTKEWFRKEFVWSKGLYRNIL